MCVKQAGQGVGPKRQNQLGDSGHQERLRRCLENWLCAALRCAAWAVEAKGAELTPSYWPL